MIRKIEINGKIYRLIGEGGGDVDYTLTEEDLKEIAKRVKFSTVIEGRISDGIGGKDYDLEIGAEYKFIPNVLETNIFVLFGGKYMNFIHKQDTEPFTLKVIGSENKKVTYEYNGELLTKDYSGYSDLGATYASALFAYNFKGAIYRAVGDGKTPEKGIDYFTPEDVEAIVNEVAENVTTARIGTVTISADKWTGTSSPYAQVVTVEGVTKKSQVDLTPSDAQLAIFHEKDLAFVTSNYRGVVTVSAIGQKPMNDYEMQVTITEVEHTDENSPIIGVTVGTPISPSKIEEKINPVKTVNNVAPDENGNVAIEIPKGANGLTPYIGENKNWWIGDNDTGVKAEGEDGVGISKIEKFSTNGKVDTYMITYTNKGASVFEVTNGTDGEDGRGISSIKKTSTNGLVDTYTITYTDKTTSTFTVTNGANGTSVTIASVSNIIDDTTEEVIGHTVNFSDGKSLTVYNGTNGKDYVLTSTDKTEIAVQAVKLIDGVPSYWQTHLNERVEDIRRAMESAGRNKSAFFFYSDAHWDNDSTYTAKLSPTLLKYLYKNTPINKTNYGGDIVHGEGSTNTDNMRYLWEWRKQLRDLPNHHSVIGNHDDGNDVMDRKISKEYVYSYLFAPEESNDIVWGGDFYYYIDDKSEKTRYLYLDIFYDGVSSTQIAFVSEALKSTPTDWHIVTICHAWFGVNYGTKENPIYPPILNGLATEMQPFFDMFDNYNARSGEFGTCGGWVELCIGGHYHLDHYEHTTGGIPVIIVEADTLHNRSGVMPQKNTTDEASVSAVVVDYNNKVVKVIRVGRGDSYEVPINVNKATYTNVIPLSIDKDGNIFNGGKGWADNSRIGSGGIYLGNGTHYVTGHIEIDPTITNTLYLKNVTFDSSTHNNYAYTIAYFDEKFAKLSLQAYSTDIASNTSLYAPKFEGTNIVEFRLPPSMFTGAGITPKYMAICCSYIGDDSIITINEPIE